MNKRHMVRAFAVAPVTLLVLLLCASVAFADGNGNGHRGKRANADPAPWTGPVPKADCGPRDRPESGLQGETTYEERFSGDSELGYNCNLRLVGRFRGEGAYSQDGPAYDGDCAYMATDRVTPLQQHLGVVVIDASDPRNPRPTAYLDDTAAGRDPHETLKTNERRHLLVVAEDARGDAGERVELLDRCVRSVREERPGVQEGAVRVGAVAPLPETVGEVAVGRRVAELDRGADADLREARHGLVAVLQPFR